MVPIAYRGSTKEGEVSFSTGIDKGSRADLVSALVIVEGDARDVISIARGGKRAWCGDKPAPPPVYTTDLRYISPTQAR
jgi:hypothetical protein